ncbi:MAG: hypothetical protein ACJ8CB_13200 [Ktedonobacteraceae bacterium]|jgi:hypothetical protein
MERYQFEIRFRLAAELKQSYSYIEMVRCLGSSGLRDIALERVGLLNYKDTPLDLRLPSDMRPDETESIGHELIRSLGQALGWDPRHFSGTLVLRGQGRANEEDAQRAKQVLTGQGFMVFLEVSR